MARIHLKLREDYFLICSLELPSEVIQVHPVLGDQKQRDCQTGGIIAYGE